MITCPKCASDCPDGARFCGLCGENLASVRNKEAPSDPYIGVKLENKFLVLHPIGTGGMGKVYAAEQLNLQKPVAVKIIHRNLIQRDDQVQRFRREAFSASRLNHPHSIQILDFGQAPDGAHFIVMEKLDGVELSKVIREQFPLPYPRVVRILSQVLSVLHEAHDNKIIHRDLKPENIMLIRRAEEEDFVKVLDFGIAKLTEIDPSMPALTQAGIVCGTPEYMSPEQARGKNLDSRTDIYSVGCILYEMLCGQVPFMANNYQAILGMHIREPAIPPSKLRPDLAIPARLEEIALTAMGKDREARYPDALSMKMALDVALHETDPEALAPRTRVVNKGGKTHLVGSGEDLAQIPPPAPKARTTQPPPLSEELFELDEVEEVAAAPLPPHRTATRERASSPSRMPKWIGLGVLGLFVLVGLVFALSGSDKDGDGPPLTPGNTTAGLVATDTANPNPAAPEPPPAAPEAPAAGPAPGAPTPLAEAPDSAPAAAEEPATAQPVPDEPAPAPAAERPATPPKQKPLTAVERQNLALEHYEKGNKALNAGRLNEAIQHFNQALSHNPNSAPVHKRLGVAHMQKGNKREAKRAFARYLNLFPNAPDRKHIKELHDSL